MTQSRYSGAPRVRGGLLGNSQPLRNDERCVVHGCANGPLDSTPIPICMTHLVEIGAMFSAMHDVVFAGDPSRRDEQNKAGEELAEFKRRTAVVYYVRLGNHIKIGTSTDLNGRMRALYVMPDALLATEPGSYDVESQRHRDFAPERIDKNRELFNPSPRLLRYIDTLRARTGHPPIRSAG